jgi:nucleoside-diphosphate-sugar epimerase
MIDANLMLPLRLLESMVDTPAKAFINTDTLLDKRINHYSLSKRHFREWLEIFPLPLTRCNVALEHFYGPGDDRTKFVTRVVTELLSDQSSMDLTPGEQQRDFIFITDVIDAMKKIIDFADGAPPGYYPFEVGGGEATEIREFVRLAQKLVGNQSTNLRFGALPYRTNEIMSSHVDLSALRELGWEPQVGLVEGLLKTIEGERRQLWPRSI